MIKLVAKQKIGFRNPETEEIVTAEPYAFSTLPDWVEKDPMYAWAVADGTIEVADATQEDDGGKKESKSQKNSKKDADAGNQQAGNNSPPQEDDGGKKE
ncbi:hypothetical protein HMPREF1147_1331 [Selenomonas sp. FOBRC9]|uniref:hypothetical protein n=1 Tax=Selenomonas sp. FOBRC9 TaxID=936573 RepID=UPI00027A631E|nr:hypothetical protein [Selenomonas sp. FOBRC9]EJP32322.1 hypothetical protein HMPREF1147_1331 [Selenomonas sp. FOBRC9]